MRTRPRRHPSPRESNSLLTLFRGVPKVVTTESVRYMHDVRRKGSENQGDLLAHPQVIPQLIFAMSSSESAERNIRRFLDADYTRLRISIRVKRSSSSPIPETVHAVQAAVDSVIKDSPLRGTLTSRQDRSPSQSNPWPLVRSQAPNWRRPDAWSQQFRPPWPIS